MRQIKSCTDAQMFVFDSVADLDEYTDGNYFDSGRLMHEESFLGEKLESWIQVQEKMQSAWEFGMTVLDEYVLKLQDEELLQLKSHKRKLEYSDESGDEIDLEKSAEAGHSVWRRYTREETTGPQEVTIITDTTAPWTTDPSDILWRGAVAIALTKLLEERGYKVELWVVNGTNLWSDEPETPVCTACCLKKCSDPLDISTLVSTVSGWFYRTATFSLMLTICDKTNHTPHYALGPVYPPKPRDLDELSRDELRIYSSGVFSFNGALSCVKAEIEKFKAKGQTEST